MTNSTLNTENQIVTATFATEKTLNLDDINEIMSFGKEPMDELRKIAKETAIKIESKNELRDIVKPLDDLIKQIDYKEIEELNKPDEKSAIKRLLLGTVKRKDQMLAKYLGISNKTDAMYTSVKTYQRNLEVNNEALLVMRAKTEQNASLIKEYIAFGQDAVNSIIGDDVKSIEKRNMLTQKVQDLQYSLLVSEQSVENISVMLGTNLMLIKKLSSVYTTTLPIVQNQINMFKITREQMKMANTMRAFDDKEKELINIGTAETIQLAKDVVDITGRKQEDFDRVRDAISALKAGAEEITKLSIQKSEECQRTFEDFAKLNNQAK